MAGGPLALAELAGGKVNYATLAHAGEPHRGRITETEKALVRDHLDEINERLARKGKRTIDPNDPTMRGRYGL
jgi:type IV secretory pathway ATPase VirB11/archaellum biosynthesis ATPase